MQIAGDNLGGDGGGPQSKAAADSLLGFGTNVTERPDCTRDLAHPNLLYSSLEAFEVAAKLVVPQGELQPECDRFGMDSVGSSDLNSVLELKAPGLKEGSKLII